MHEPDITLRLDEPLGMIEANLYGHFAEHLGRCIDEGIWVGEDSEMENEDGLRRDVIEALRRVEPPILRWPGGCFADAYNWRDGIGPREERPRRINVWWDKEEDNQFGTDEFVRFCRQIGAEPYICGNVGSGSPREMMEWLEYCNWEGDTTLAQLRAANGNAEPHNVYYWGVGNENWGCGGRYDAAPYAREYRRFASYLRRMDPDIELVSCGHDPDWNLQFFNTLGDVGLVDHHSIHSYYKCGPGRGFNEDEYYGLFHRARAIEEQIIGLVQVLGHFERGRRIGIAIDEWGVWHPEADVGLYQPNTLRDALSAAVVFDIFNKNAEYLSMCNIAQLVNVLQCLIQTDGEAMWKTPTYHAFDLYRPHMSNVSVRCDIRCERKEFSLDDRQQSVPLVSASASMDEASEEICLCVSNLHLTEGAQVTVELHEGEAMEATVRTLTAQSADDVNSAEEPELVSIGEETSMECEGSLELELPAKSTSAVVMKR